jgi:hypothetical protein
MSIDPIEIKLRIVNSIIEEWEGFSAQILSYHGHPGIAGFLLILLSSPQGRYFAIRCGACIKIKTKFNWNIRNLRLDYSIEHHQIYLKDDSGFYLLPNNDIYFYELSNKNLVIKIEDYKAKNKKISLLKQFDLKKSFIFPGQDTRDDLLDISALRFDSTGNFHGLENILSLNVCSKQIVIKNPTYFYYHNTIDRRKILLKIQIEDSNAVKFFDKESGDLIVEAEDAAIIDDGLFYSSAASRGIGESISESIEDETFPPQLGLYSLMFKEIIQIDVRS